MGCRCQQQMPKLVCDDIGEHVLLEQFMCDGCIPDATIERMGAVRADRC